jgi:hypothetical protein
MKHQPILAHFCNEPLRCPCCNHRFWVWAENYSRSATAASARKRRPRTIPEPPWADWPPPPASPRGGPARYCPGVRKKHHDCSFTCVGRSEAPDGFLSQDGGRIPRAYRLSPDPRRLVDDRIGSCGFATSFSTRAPRELAVSRGLSDGRERGVVVRRQGVSLDQSGARAACTHRSFSFLRRIYFGPKLSAENESPLRSLSGRRSRRGRREPAKRH